MARVTIEDCVEQIENRFLLVQAAVRRTRQLVEGSRPLVQSKNRESIIALREIAAGKVKLSRSEPRDLLAKPSLLHEEEDEAIAQAAIQEVEVAQTSAEQLEEAGESGAEAEHESDEDQSAKEDQTES